MKKLIIVILLIIISTLAYLLAYNPPSTNTPRKSTSDQTELNLSGKGLTNVPEYVFGRTDLKSLDLSDNKLTGAIPGEIQLLKKLTYLDLSNNQMTGVPAEVGQLRDLQELNLSNNNLTGLPHELGNLKKLNTLNISRNNYSQQDLDIILERLSPSVNVIK